MTVADDKPTAPAGAPAAGRPAPVWPERLGAVASAFHAWLLRPRVRLCVTGVTLLLVGGLFMINSVWTLPLVVAGALMVGVAWIGHRLEGRFAIEWGDAGTRLAFNATIKTPQPAPDAPALTAAADPAPRAPALAAAADPAPGAPALAAAADPAPAAVIEGEAHTVEINVGELKALIAAAEASPDPTVPDIRVRRRTDDGGRTPRPAA